MNTNSYHFWLERKRLVQTHSGYLHRQWVWAYSNWKKERSDYIWLIDLLAKENITNNLYSFTSITVPLNLQASLFFLIPCSIIFHVITILGDIFVGFLNPYFCSFTLNWYILSIGQVMPAAGVCTQFNVNNSSHYKHVI